MLQDEQISKLTKLKELLDAGILNEEEFASEKSKILSQAQHSTSSQSRKQVRETETFSKTSLNTSSVNLVAANVNLSTGIVLPLGITAILTSLISAVFSALSDIGGFYDYLVIANIFDLVGTIAVLALWFFAFKKLSTMPEGKWLGRIPLWVYLYLGAWILGDIALTADPEAGVIMVIFLALVLVFGYLAHIPLYKAYIGKMRTYSLVWMVALPLEMLFTVTGSDLIGLIIQAVVYVFLMIAFLERKEA